MGTIIGILFLIGVLLEGRKLISEGIGFLGQGSASGCLMGALAIIFGLAFISTGLGAPIGLIIIAVVCILLATDKNKGNNGGSVPHIGNSNNNTSSSKSQFELGNEYYFGKGVSKDYNKAFQLYRKAAKQGHADAQYYLGVMYEKGQGVPKNDEKAVEWYSKAAEQGHELAKNNLQKLIYTL